MISAASNGNVPGIAFEPPSIVNFGQRNWARTRAGMKSWISALVLVSRLTSMQRYFFHRPRHACAVKREKIERLFYRIQRDLLFFSRRVLFQKRQKHVAVLFIRLRVRDEIRHVAPGNPQVLRPALAHAARVT